MGTGIRNRVSERIALGALAGTKYLLPNHELTQRRALDRRPRVDQFFDLGLSQRAGCVGQRGQDGLPDDGLIGVLSAPAELRSPVVSSRISTVSSRSSPCRWTVAIVR